MEPPQPLPGGAGGRGHRHGARDGAGERRPRARSRRGGRLRPRRVGARRRAARDRRGGARRRSSPRVRRRTGAAAAAGVVEGGRARAAHPLPHGGRPASRGRARRAGGGRLRRRRGPPHAPRHGPSRARRHSTSTPGIRNGPPGMRSRHGDARGGRTRHLRRAVADARRTRPRAGGGRGCGGGRAGACGGGLRVVRCDALPRRGRARAAKARPQDPPPHTPRHEPTGSAWSY